MAKDYSGKRTSARHQGGISKQLLLALVCFLFGYLSASIFDLTSLSSWINAQLLAQHTGKVASKLIPQQANLPQPKFEFYTLLAKEHHETTAQVASAAPATVAPATVAPTTASPVAITLTRPTTGLPTIKNPPVSATMVAGKPVPSLPKSAENGKGAYLVQVAAFKSYQEAERMKASLVLKGFMVNISIVKQQQISWYRVNLGPFASRPLALKAQMDVARSEHIVGMVRKMDA